MPPGESLLLRARQSSRGQGSDPHRAKARPGGGPGTALGLLEEEGGERKLLQLFLTVQAN